MYFWLFTIVLGAALLIAKAVWEGYALSKPKKRKKKRILKKLKKWWQKNIRPRWRRATFFKKTYIIFSGVIGSALIVLFCILYLQLFLIPFGLSEIDEINANFALAFIGTVTGGVALFTGFMAILRTEENKRQSNAALSQSKAANKQSDIANKQKEIANRQADIAEQGLITDRLNKAVEGLGKNDATGAVVEVRLGALYALERIAKDSIRDHIQIMEILCSYVCTNSPRENPPQKIREDVQAALIIIGRREQWPNGEKRLADEREQRYRIYFQSCDLSDALLFRANLTNANINDTSLNNVNFAGADMRCARIESTDLSNINFDRVKTAGAYSYISDFSKCKNLTQEQLDLMFCGKKVKIPEGLTRPEHWPTDDLSWEEFDKLCWEQVARILPTL